MEGDWDSYMWELLQKETWGDHLTLKALANVYGVGIRVWRMEVDPKTEDHVLQTHEVLPANDPDPVFFLEVSNFQETCLHLRVHLIILSNLTSTNKPYMLRSKFAFACPPYLIVASNLWV